MENLLSERARSQQGSRIRELLRLTEQPHMLSLAGGLPAPDGFPGELVARAFERAMGHVGVTGPAAMQYAPTEGVAMLREQVAAEHQMPVADVLVTTGSQQALDLLARVLCDPGDVIVAEDPSYLGALQAFRFAGVHVVGVPGDADGLDVDAVDAALTAHAGRAKAVYVVPNFHNPSGSVLAAERRTRLLEVAGRHGVLVIEDDPYGEIRFAGDAIPALGGVGRPVVRLGSASKVLAPGLRVGWLSGPSVIVGAAVRAKQAADLHTSSLNQLIVAEARSDRDAFERHLDAARDIYRARARALAAAMESELGDRFSFVEPSGGMFLWGTVDGIASTEALLQLAIDEGVAFVPGSAFSVEGASHASSMRLSFATLDAAALADACGRLGRAVRRMDG